MSPLARSLLALACAALLHAAFADYPTECKSKAKGRNGLKIEFPLIYLNASLGWEICFDTRDKNGNKDVYCQNEFDYGQYQYELVGLSATACDWDVEPDLKITNDLTTICVHRNGPSLERPATLEIWEFCDKRSWPLPGATHQL